MRTMTVGKLRKVIEGLSDDVQIYTIDGDHEAIPVYIVDDRIVMEPDDHRAEFFGEKYLQDGEYSVQALIVQI